jgi:type IV secretory pathway ATPase VirB11/archaellum biosynthesis ATPase
MLSGATGEGVTEVLRAIWRAIIAGRAVTPEETPWQP